MRSPWQRESGEGGSLLGSRLCTPEWLPSGREGGREREGEGGREGGRREGGRREREEL